MKKLSRSKTLELLIYQIIKIGLRKALLPHPMISQIVEDVGHSALQLHLKVLQKFINMNLNYVNFLFNNF